MEIQRLLSEIIASKIGKQKVLILYGTRRVGKTYILQQIENDFKKQTLFLNGEDIDDQERLAKRSSANTN